MSQSQTLVVLIGSLRGLYIAPTLRKYSRIYRELVDSFLRIILSGIFLVVAKGLGSIEVLVESFFLIGNCLCFSTVWSLFCLEGVVCPQGFWIWFWIFSVLDSGSWGLDFGVWFWTPTVWLSSASTWGAKSTHSLQRGLRENPKGWSSSKCAKCSSQRCVT